MVLSVMNMPHQREISQLNNEYTYEDIWLNRCPFYVTGNCCNVVEENQEFARQILVAFAAEQTLFMS